MATPCEKDTITGPRLLFSAQIASGAAEDSPQNGLVLLTKVPLLIYSETCAL
jgi:hypothetical protein